MSFLRTVLTGGMLYLLARWIFGIGSPIADSRTLRRWLDLLLAVRPNLRRLSAHFQLSLRAFVGITQGELSLLKKRIERGAYADDRC